MNRTKELKKCPRCEKYGNPVLREARYKKNGQAASISTCEYCGWKIRSQDQQSQGVNQKPKAKVRV
jgi:hypothetical protein